LNPETPPGSLGVIKAAFVGVQWLRPAQFTEIGLVPSAMKVSSRLMLLFKLKVIQRGSEKRVFRG
jgi:hypothetical protein